MWRAARSTTRFLSTPSGWRATQVPLPTWRFQKISIHALRVEGDEEIKDDPRVRILFLSTPSGWRATARLPPAYPLRPEFLSTPSGWRATSVHRTRDPVDAISIHALRVEGDTLEDAYWWLLTDFYPRPPGGGRLQCHADYIAHRAISIHALRVEGDGAPLPRYPHKPDFYPRPPGGGRLWCLLYTF